MPYLCSTIIFTPSGIWGPGHLRVLNERLAVITDGSLWSVGVCCRSRSFLASYGSGAAVLLIGGLRLGGER